MKKLLIFLTLLIISGCQALSKDSQPAQTPQAYTECSEKHKSALTKPEEIQLDSQAIVKSGQASADKSVGYTFTAQAGQKLSYRTKDDICIWIYAPDTQLLSSGNIPQSGKYTLQVSAPKGSTTFNLEISLDNPQLSSSSTFTSTTDNSSSGVKPERPAADEFVREYYSNINNRRYKDAWGKLSPRFQSISSSYSDYVHWWDSVSEIKIGEITPIDQSSDFAVVNTELWYVMNNGQVYQDSKKRIYLIWSNESNRWLFNRKSST